MDRPRPSEDGSDVQARKVNIAMRPLVNCHSENSLAMTLVRKSTELAVATIFTVAVRKFPTFQSPVGHSARPHDRVKRTRPRARPHHSISEKLVVCRSEEHTSELQSLICISYTVFCLKTKQ